MGTVDRGHDCSPGEPRRIVLVRLSHLGDIVCSLPVFHALRALHPRAAIAWACQPEYSGLLEGLPGLERTIPFERRGGLRAWPALRARLRAFAPDLAVDVQGNLKSAAVTRLSGAPRRVGWHRADWREPWGSFVLTERAPAVERGIAHVIERVGALARHLGHAGPLRFDLGLDEAERERGARRLDEFHGAGQGLVVIHLARPEDPRSWPVEGIAELAGLLARAGRPHVILTGPDEAEEGRRLAAALPEHATRRHWIAQRGPRELAAFFAAAADRGARFLGSDSGPLHLAWSAGLPAVCLAGPQSHLRTGPWPPPGRDGSTHRAVLASSPPTCAPCLERRCRHADGPVCMSAIDAARVFAALA